MTSDMHLNYNVQAAWIVDNSDIDYTDSDDNEDDAMVLEERGSDFLDQENENGFEPDDDESSLPGEYDEQTETDSIMMVSICYESNIIVTQILSPFW